MKLISVRIFDHDYHIRSDASGEKILQIAEYINEQIEELQSSITVRSRADLTAMVAFKIATEYFQAKDSLNELRRQVETQAAELASRIDENLD